MKTVTFRPTKVVSEKLEGEKIKHPSKSLTDIINEALVHGLNGRIYLPRPDSAEDYHPDMKESLSEVIQKSKEIKSGPGAMDRLRAKGISPMDVLIAKRLKKQGKAYNKELEIYFDLL